MAYSQNHTRMTYQQKRIPTIGIDGRFRMEEAVIFNSLSLDYSRNLDSAIFDLSLDVGSVLEEVSAELKDWSEWLQIQPTPIDNILDAREKYYKHKWGRSIDARLSSPLDNDSDVSEEATLSTSSGLSVGTTDERLMRSNVSPFRASLTIN